MMDSWEIQGSTLLRVGIATVFVGLGLDQLLFTQSWVSDLPLSLQSFSTLSPSTIVHMGAAVQIVFGASLMLGLFTRASAFVLIAYEALIAFASGQGQPISQHMVLGISVLAILLQGGDRATLDYHYLLGPQPGTEPLPDSPQSPPQALAYLNQILFGVIGIFFITSLGIGLAYVRDTFALDALQTSSLPLPAAAVPTTAVRATTSAPSVAPQQKPTAPSQKPEPTTAGFSAAEVATHNSAASCYTIVNGYVYDVTAWIKKHPGGSGTILSMCGVDASAAFDAQHEGDRQPEQELARFKIGPLAQ